MITHAGFFRGSCKRTLASSLSIALIATLATGCSARRPEPRPFFQPEQGRDTHGRKTLFDHLVEVDPGRAKTEIAANYPDLAPERIAVLPFVDHGSAQYVVDKIPLSFRNQKQREEWAWTYANRLRRGVTGQLAQREFEVVPLVAIDTVLADRGIDSWEKLQAVPPEELGQWLGADTVVYGEVTDYQAYYAALISAWEVGVRVRMVSTSNGEQLFAAGDRRYSVNIAPALDPMDIA
jgi:TolB-like protein